MADRTDGKLPRCHLDPRRSHSVPLTVSDKLRSIGHKPHGFALAMHLFHYCRVTQKGAAYRRALESVRSAADYFTGLPRIRVNVTGALALVPAGPVALTV